MTQKRFSLLVLPAFALMLAFSVQTALADAIDAPSGTTPGCDSRVLTAMQDKANARDAYDVAATEQVINKPDSILAMTCFNDSAGEAANKLGSMFSGDFTTPLSKIVPDSLTAFYDDFKDAKGNDTTKVDYTQTALGAPGDIKNCNDMKDLWTEVDSEGIQPDVPYYRYSDLVNAGSQPTGTTTAASTSKFGKDWTTSDGTDNDFGKVNTDIGALPKAATPTTFIADPVNTDDLCGAMNKATITPPATCP